MMQRKPSQSYGVSAVAIALTGIGVFLTGLGAGITMTLLFAPMSGSDTRKLIGRTVANSENWVRDRALAAEKFVHTQGEHVRNRAKEVMEAMDRS